MLSTPLVRGFAKGSAKGARGETAKGKAKGSREGEGEGEPRRDELSDEGTPGAGCPPTPVSGGRGLVVEPRAGRRPAPEAVGQTVSRCSSSSVGYCGGSASWAAW
ncbi:hypothetical protein Arub01_37490 [Actinomadura rubrobrunea]|uniref:Uncharacterized protein n=1 Tax=Actinomadura rubrobrunea TaxID=115335 RepID=A0A9W6PWZ3_9ACTN|nr:hypothetical protein Arub01_37490 [Actinomadura rubrobrunea]